MDLPNFVSEVSSNHDQDIKRCYEFIEKSAEIGCDGVKFQLFKIDQLFAPEILRRSKEHAARAKWELPESFIPKLASKCRENSIEFSCTPFYLDGVDILAPHVDFFKVASYELLWDDLLIKCVKTGLPLVISTGMATLEEVGHAVDVIKAAGCNDLTILHCVSGYPTPIDQVNLKVIDTLRANFGCKVGWSDHTVKTSVVNRAVNKYNCSMVEFHLDLDARGAEFKSGHCWLPDQAKAMISNIKDGFLADGDGIKNPVEAEINDRLWRADPSDGLRPFRQIRESYGK